MLVKKKGDIASSEITPREWVLDRRKFLAGAGLLAGAAAAGGLVLGDIVSPGTAALAASGKGFPGLAKSPLSTTGEKLTPLKDITHYNNYYEFSTDKYEPADLAQKFKTQPWTVEVSGLVNRKKTYDIDALLKLAAPEERVYRMRCVEGWSMVIPWVGFPLARLIQQVQPLSKARYVAFTSVYRPGEMPGQQRSVLEWPYQEGLRMDEAMHPLAILCFGMYGEVLPSQDGAPLRLVVPWKYGFKSAKAIVTIRFVDQEPPTTWNRMAPGEYGFYSNVNPEVDHPRWSQAKERRIGEFFKRDTLKFNGYGEQVASLYAGMDLRKNF
jgi:methionine sulfoxide reductase catalytic subunit